TESTSSSSLPSCSLRMRKLIKLFNSSLHSTMEKSQLNITNQSRHNSSSTEAFDARRPSLSMTNSVESVFSESCLSNWREILLRIFTFVLSEEQVGWLKAEDQTILTLHNKVVTHNSRISVTHDNHRTWQLHIRQVKESDRGCYMCQINTSIMKKQVGCVDVHVRSEVKRKDRANRKHVTCVTFSEVLSIIKTLLTMEISSETAVWKKKDMSTSSLWNEVTICSS
ncbi:hypothetical protein L9F63_010800, partial [Diploptera punctata]